MIRAALGKYWALYTIGIIAQLLVVIIVIVGFFAATNNSARWLMNSINDLTASLRGPAIFSFIADWAGVISIGIVCIVFVPTFITIMKYHHDQALTRIGTWAKNAISRLTEPGSEENTMENQEELKQQLQSIIYDSQIARSDTITMTNGLGPKIDRAVECMLKLEDCMCDYTEPEKPQALLRMTIGELGEIVTSTQRHTQKSARPFLKRLGRFRS